LPDDYAREAGRSHGRVFSEGFTAAGRPWLPVNPNYYRLNVDAQRRSPTSNYNFYKSMSRLRRTDTLKHGDLQTYNVTDSVYIIKRYAGGGGRREPRTAGER